jgi:hypothetical protein
MICAAAGRLMYHHSKQWYTNIDAVLYLNATFTYMHAAVYKNVHHIFTHQFQGWIDVQLG